MVRLSYAGLMSRVDRIRWGLHGIVAFAVAVCTLAGAALVDAGQRLRQHEQPRRDLYATAIDPIEPGHVYAGGGNQLFLSIDGGASFSPLPPVPATEKIYAVAVLRDTGIAAHTAGRHRQGPRLVEHGRWHHVRAIRDRRRQPDIANLRERPAAASSPSRRAGPVTCSGPTTAGRRRALWTCHLILPGTAAPTWRSRPAAPCLLGRSHGLYKSVDGGAHWAHVKAGCRRSRRFDGQAIAGSTPSTRASSSRSSLRQVLIARTMAGRGGARETFPHRFGDRLLRPAATCSLQEAIQPRRRCVLDEDDVAGRLARPRARSGHRRLFLGSDNVQRMRTSIARSLDDGESWLTDTVGVGSPPAVFLAADPGRGLYAVTRELDWRTRSAPEGAWRDVSPPLQNGGQGFVGSLVVTGPLQCYESRTRFIARRMAGRTGFRAPAVDTPTRGWKSRRSNRATRPSSDGLSKPSFASGNSYAWSTPAQSVDGGRTWASIATGLPLVTNHLVATGNSRLVAGTTCRRMVQRQCRSVVAKGRRRRRRVARHAHPARCARQGSSPHGRGRVPQSRWRHFLCARERSARSPAHATSPLERACIS